MGSSPLCGIDMLSQVCLRSPWISLSPGSTCRKEPPLDPHVASQLLIHMKNPTSKSQCKIHLLDERGFSTATCDLQLWRVHLARPTFIPWHVIVILTQGRNDPWIPWYCQDLLTSLDIVRRSFPIKGSLPKAIWYRRPPLPPTLF